MKFRRIAFRADVPNPAVESMEVGNWLRLYAEPVYAIDRDGDTVTIRHVESGRARVYPWDVVAGGELAPELVEVATAAAKRGKK